MVKSHDLMSSVPFYLFFPFKTFKKKTFRNASVSVLNSLDLDHARHFVGPDLGQNCLQMLSTLAGK